MSTPAAATVAGQRTVVSLIGAGHCYSHMTSVALAPLFPLLRDALDVSYVALGALIAAFALASSVGQIPVGILVDRYGGRLILVLGLVCMGFAFVAAGMVSGYWPIMAMMALAGLANSVFHPADYAILSQRIDEAYLGRAVSVHAFVGYAGWAIAPVGMLGMSILFGWQGALIALGILGLMIAALIHWRGAAFEDQGTAGQPRQRAKWQGLGQMVSVMASAPMVALFLYFMLTSMTVGGVTSFSAIIMMDLFGVDREAGNFALTAYLAAMAGGVLVGGMAADRIANHNTLVSWTIAGGALGLVLVAPGWGGYFTGLAALGASGFLMGIASPSRDLLVRAFSPPESVGLAFGYTSTGLSIGFAAGPPVIGWLMDLARPDLGLLALAGISMCAVFTVFGMRSGPARRR